MKFLQIVKHMKLRTKLLFTFVVILSMMLVMGLVSLIGISSISSETVRVLQYDARQSENSAGVSSSALLLRLYEKDIFIDIANIPKIKEYYQSWGEEAGNLAEGIDKLESTLKKDTKTNNEKDLEIIAMMKESMKAYRDGFKEIYEKILAGKIKTTAEATQAMNIYMQPIRKLVDNSQIMAHSYSANMYKVEEKVISDTRLVWIIVLVLIVIPIAVGCFLVIYIVKVFKKIVGQIVISSESLKNSSEELKSSAQTLSQSTSEQAASLEEITSTIEQMGANISQNATNARNSNEIIQKTAVEAEQGGTAVMETVEAMKKIVSKIRIIENIATKTNMLSLNAAIEAAHAGAQGKGFAVVANEVRQLAEQSQEAANEIIELADSSVVIAERAGVLISGTIPAIKRTAAMAGEITLSSNEQDLAVSHINKGIEQINLASQSNSTMAEETAATAEEMSGHAVLLKNITNEL